MSIFVYRGDLPRTKLDKIQRYKLKDIIENKCGGIRLLREEDESKPVVSQNDDDYDEDVEEIEEDEEDDVEEEIEEESSESKEEKQES